MPDPSPSFDEQSNTSPEKTAIISGNDLTLNSPVISSSRSISTTLPEVLPDPFASFDQPLYENPLFQPPPPNSHPNPTPLHLAARDGDIELVKKLISEGADLNALYENMPPVYFAIKPKHVEVVRLILEAGGTHVVPHRFVLPIPKPIFEAYESGDIEILRLLIKYGADVEEKDFYGMTVLGLVMWSPRRDEEYEARRMELVKMLLAAGASVSQPPTTERQYLSGSSPCLQATGFGLHEYLELFLKEKSCNLEEKYYPCYADVPTGFTMLHLATKSRNIIVVKMLLEAGANINSRSAAGLTPLHYLADTSWKTPEDFYSNFIKETPKEREEEIEVAKILIAGGADVMAEIKLSDEWTARYYPYRDFTTPLHMCASNGDKMIGFARLLLENKADVNARAEKGRTPLHVAVLRRLTSSIDREGLSPEQISKAGSNQQLEMVRFLLDNGADIDARMDDGCTALDVAVELGFIETAQILLGARPKVPQRKWSYKVYVEVPQGRGRGRGGFLLSSQ